MINGKLMLATFLLATWGAAFAQTPGPTPPPITTRPHKHRVTERPAEGPKPSSSAHRSL